MQSIEEATGASPLLAIIVLLRHRYELTRLKGGGLFTLYLIYLGLSVVVFPPHPVAVALRRLSR